MLPLTRDLGLADECRLYPPVLLWAAIGRPALAPT
jgi:hypothetical protein